MALRAVPGHRQVRNHLLVFALSELIPSQNTLLAPESVISLDRVSRHLAGDVYADLWHLSQIQRVTGDVATNFRRDLSNHVCKGGHDTGLTPFLIAQLPTERVYSTEYFRDRLLVGSRKFGDCERVFKKPRTLVRGQALRGRVQPVDLAFFSQRLRSRQLSDVKGTRSLSEKAFSMNENIALRRCMPSRISKLFVPVVSQRKGQQQERYRIPFEDGVDQLLLLFECPDQLPLIPAIDPKVAISKLSGYAS